MYNTYTHTNWLHRKMGWVAKGEVDIKSTASPRTNRETFILFYFILLYNTVLVLPYIDMNPPRVYVSSQS